MLFYYSGSATVLSHFSTYFPQYDKRYKRISLRRKGTGGMTDLKGVRHSREYEYGARRKIPRTDSIDQFSGEEDMSD